MRMGLPELFKKYDETKRIDDATYDKIRSKRDSIIKLIKDNDKTLSFETFGVGSYAVRTGVKYKDKNFDIDVALFFNITEENTARQVKNSVYKAIEGLKDVTIRYRRKCITVLYTDKNDDDLFHIDFAVFGYDRNKDIYYLADGKQNDEVKWMRQNPKELVDYLNWKDGENELRDTYRRIVRILKLWKNKCFSDSLKDTAPPSLGLSVAVRQLLSLPSFTYADDLSTIKKVFLSLKTFSFSSPLYLKVPMSPPALRVDHPYYNIYYKMALNSKCIDQFQAKVSEAVTIISGLPKTTLNETCKELQKLFPDFPNPSLLSGAKTTYPNEKVVIKKNERGNA